MLNAPLKTTLTVYHKLHHEALLDVNKVYNLKENEIKSLRIFYEN